MADKEIKEFAINGDRLLLVLDVLESWAAQYPHAAGFSLDKLNSIFRIQMNFQNQEDEVDCRNHFRKICEKQLDLLYALLSASENGIYLATFDAEPLIIEVMRLLPTEEKYMKPYYGFVNILKAIAYRKLTEADFR